MTAAQATPEPATAATDFFFGIPPGEPASRARRAELHKASKDDEEDRWDDVVYVGPSPGADASLEETSRAEARTLSSELPVQPAAFSEPATPASVATAEALAESDEEPASEAIVEPPVRVEPGQSEKPELSEHDLRELCGTVADGSAAEAREAIKRLLRGDARMIPLLADRFPGRVTFDPFGGDRVERDPNEHSPLISFLVTRPDIGAEIALLHLDSRHHVIRWYAVFLFDHIRDTRCIRALLPRLHDEEPRISHLAADVLSSYASAPEFEIVIKHLRNRLDAQGRDVRRRAMYFLGYFKDVGSVPHLINCLMVREPELVQEASTALTAITLQTFGTSRRKWQSWWEKNKDRSRIEWLIDGLRHKDRNIRYAASVELTNLSRETFGYNFDGKRKERETAVTRWEQWWEGEKQRMQSLQF